jgi:glycosyltransferase involved in cell wall biosynthesis
MRPYWKGYLKLALVSCPIALHAACSSTERIAFRQINKVTGNRLRQQLIDEETREPVAPEHKGRGYEVAKGQYLIVEDAELEAFLAAANLWIIPYRKDVAGVSVPSRFYNLLAVGRPVVLVSEPEAEAALTVVENGLGWVVTPGRADQLAEAIRAASCSDDVTIAERAVKAAAKFDRVTAMNAYAALVDELLRNPELAEQR